MQVDELSPLRRLLRFVHSRVRVDVADQSSLGCTDCYCSTRRDAKFPHCRLQLGGHRGSGAAKRLSDVTVGLACRDETDHIELAR